MTYNTLKNPLNIQKKTNYTGVTFIAPKYIVNWNTQELVNSFYDLFNLRK